MRYLQSMACFQGSEADQHRTGAQFFLNDPAVREVEESKSKDLIGETQCLD